MVKSPFFAGNDWQVPLPSLSGTARQLAAAASATKGDWEVMNFWRISPYIREIFTYNKYTYQILPFLEDHPSMKKRGSPGKRK
jgi:hypothetical protein